MIELQTGRNDGFGVYVVCRTSDALMCFVASNVSRQFGRVLESVFSQLSGEQVVVVQLNWIADYQRCASHFIDASVGLYTRCYVDRVPQW